MKKLSLFNASVCLIKDNWLLLWCRRIMFIPVQAYYLDFFSGINMELKFMESSTFSQEIKLKPVSYHTMCINDLIKKTIWD